MTEVNIRAQSVDRFLAIADPERVAEVHQLAPGVRQRLAGRRVWNISSTAVGGGVAELLRSLLPYVRGLDIDARWWVIRGTPQFFRITKQLHYALHGCRGDPAELGDEARAQYEATMEANAAELPETIRARDIVILHDPQTAGLASYMSKKGALVVWRCHIGHDRTNRDLERGWTFLAPYLQSVEAFVFSRKAYVPKSYDKGKTTIITPSIDAFSPKNQDLDEATVRAILVHVGLVEGPPGDAQPTFTRNDGSQGRVDRQADVCHLGRAPAWNTPLVVHVSRWDRLADPVGAVLAFADLVGATAPRRAELVLAGPNVHALADDPQAAAQLDKVVAVWRELPHAVRSRIHLASLPTADVEENAAIVNALQRHAAVVVQKSLREGFGLTVTEALWKAKPVLASAVGGIRDQIVDGVHGLLVKDPDNLVTFAAALRRLLEDAAYAQQLGENARVRVLNEFLDLHRLLKYLRWIERFDRA